MGIRNFDINNIKEILLSQRLTFNNLKMLQLGDQVIREKKIRAKQYFEELGVFVLSIDINGKGGSLPIDLSKPIDYPEYKSYFDIVTNFGTSEHVSNHLICFENMYCLCKKGGIIYNLVPREGFWNRGSHRKAHKYNVDFFANLSKQYSCEILINRIVTGAERFRGDTIMAVLKK